MEPDSNGLQQALLELQGDDWQQKEGRSTFNAVFNLSKVIIGAGMMAIPRAYFQIGSLIGTSMLLGVALLTYYTLAALVRGSSATGATTYSQLALLTCGCPVMKLLQLAVLAFCFGFGVVYLVVIRDLLLGTPPSCNGLLCEVLGLSPSSALADPRLVLAAVALIFCAPLLMLRSMDKLATLNVVGVAAIILLAVVSAGLAIQGLVTGTSTPLPAFPQWDLLGPSRVQQVEALTAVVPVLIACYVAHQSLHPLMPLVKPYSDAKMKQVVALALMISFGVYAMLAVGASLVFGAEVEVNVLNNFSVSGLQPLVGAVPARLISWSIRGGYLISLLASLLLYMHPLRGCLAEMLWQDDVVTATTSSNTAQAAGSHLSSQPTAVATTAMPASLNRPETSDINSSVPVVAATATAEAGHTTQQQQQRWQQQEQRYYYALTYGLLASMVLVAVLASNIWVVLSAIGDLASTIQAFVVPGLIALVLTAHQKATGLLPQSRQHLQLRQQPHLEGASSERMVLLAQQTISSSAVKIRRSRFMLQRVVHMLAGGFVVALGLTLFANGIYQRL